MAHHERPITLKGLYDPDLAKHIKASRKPFTDAVTGEPIPVGSEYYVLPIRAGRNLVNAHVSVDTYNRLQEEQE